MLDISAVSFSSFCLILFGVGAYIFVLAIIGIRAAGNRSQGCVHLYSVMFFVLIALHSAMVFGFLFFENKTIQVLQDLNSHGDNNAIRNYLDHHRADFKWAGIVVLSLELLTFCMSVCCSRSVSGSLDEEVLLAEMQHGLVSSEINYVSATPQTDERRAQMHAKYGGFEKKNGYQQV